jgi:hypothetical protein
LIWTIPAKGKDWQERLPVKIGSLSYFLNQEAHKTHNRMRTYNQQIEDAYAASKRQGDLMRDREIERSAGQDRRNRYREDLDQYNYQQEPFRHDMEDERFRNASFGQPSRYDDFDEPRGRYPDTYRSAMDDYKTVELGNSQPRQDYLRSFDRPDDMGRQPVHRGKGPKMYKRSDERIREDICERLTEDPYVDASELEIEVRQGEVILSGSVGNRAEKRRVEDLVESVSGIVNVENGIKLNTPQHQQ